MSYTVCEYALNLAFIWLSLQKSNFWLKSDQSVMFHVYFLSVDFFFLLKLPVITILAKISKVTFFRTIYKDK